MPNNFYSWRRAIAAAERQYERDISREPMYRRRALGLDSRGTVKTQFTAAWECKGCGGQSECHCGGES